MNFTDIDLLNDWHALNYQHKIIGRWVTTAQILPLIEELAVAIRKRKAFPVLEMSTEKLKKRFFAEMPEDVFSVPPNYYKSWINAIDKFIEISWESYSSDFHETSDKQIKQFKDSTNSIMQHLFQQK